jgi:hypothetical protein
MNYCKYNLIPQSYFGPQEVVPDPRCNGWTAINKGDTLVIVNGIKLKPFPPGHPELSGESFGVQGNLGETYGGVISITFAAGGVAPEVMIIQKYYMNS